MVSSEPRSWLLRAALMGSMSPTRSATVTSGVASFSTIAVVGREPSDVGVVAHLGDEVAERTWRWARRDCRAVSEPAT